VTDLDRLLRAVLECPADDTARLVMADYLDEHVGSPAARARAELIRVGVELARTPAAVGIAGPTGGVARVTGPNPEHARLTARIETLLRRWGARFLPKPLRHCGDFFAVAGDTLAVPPSDLYVRFARGFIAAMGVELRSARIQPPVIDYPEDVERFGLQLRSLLAANPVTEATVTVGGCRPEVRFRVRTDGQTWYATADVVDGEEGAATNDYRTRRELVAAIPAFVSSALTGVEFERVPEPDDLELTGHPHPLDPDEDFEP
jgi:uncharacterized protein (TIGR02996 family)